jgi:hypothetical protein
MLAPFLAALFPDPADGLLELRALPSGVQTFLKSDAVGDVESFMLSHTDQNVFFGLATRIEKDGALAGTAAHCHRVHALWADLDFKTTAEPDVRAMLTVCPVAPSIVVYSGGGLHVYWLLKEGVPADATLKVWLRRLARTIKADRSVADPARVLRVPGTMNVKYTPPRPAQIEVFEPTRRYTFDDFTWLHAESDEAKPADGDSRRAVVPVAADALQRAAAIIAPFWPGDGVRHTFALALGGWLARNGLDAAAAADFAHAAATQAGDEDEASTSDRSRAAGDAAAAVFNDEHAYGYPKLVELAPDLAHVSSGVLTLLGVREAPVSTIATRTAAVDDRSDDAFPESAIIGLGREFTDLYSEYFESPRVFWFFSFLTNLGAWLSKKVALAGGLHAPPRLYTALIGTSGQTRKSTALDQTEDFFERVRAMYYPPRADAKEPGIPRILHGSGSAEAIAKDIDKDEHRHCPVLMKFDELKSLIAKGRQDGSQLMPLLTNAFEKGRWSNTTLTYSTKLTDPAISLLSACTSRTFDTAFGGAEADIGFLNRLWLVPGHRDADIALPEALPADRLNALVVKVGQIVRQCIAREGVTLASFTPDAKARWTEWYVSNKRRRAELDEHDTATRLDTYGLRLCILNAACLEVFVSDQLIVTLPAVEAALQMLEWQRGIRRRYYPIVADNRVAALALKVLRVLERQPGAWFSRREVYRAIHGSRDGAAMFDKAINGLVQNFEVEPETQTGSDGHKVIARRYRLRADRQEAK